MRMDSLFNRRKLIRLAPLMFATALVIFVLSRDKADGMNAFSVDMVDLQRFQRDSAILSTLASAQDLLAAANRSVGYRTSRKTFNLKQKLDLKIAKEAEKDPNDLRYLFDKRDNVTALKIASGTSHPLFPGYVIRNSRICEGRVDVLVYLHSAPDHDDRRRQIREAWGSRHTFTDLSVRLMFILGTPGDTMQQLHLLTEASTYGDIVQGDFIDDFKNLTYKAITMMDWVNAHCTHARYVIKVDDDQFVDMFRAVSEFLPEIHDKKFGVVCDHKEKMEILREKKDRWYVSYEVLPKRTHWPPFCPGYFTVFTADLVPVAYNRSFSFDKLIPTDDAFLFGLLVEDLKKDLFVHNIHGKITSSHRPNPAEEMKANGKFEYVSFGVVKATDVRTLWSSRMTKLSPWEQAHSTYIRDIQIDKNVILITK